MDTATDLRSARSSIVSYLNTEVIGPAGGDEEVLTEDPAVHYMAGILFPVGESVEDSLDDQSDGAASAESGSTGKMEDPEDEPLVLAGQQLPSSLGISFYLTGDSTIQVKASAGRYTEQARLQPDSNEQPGASAADGDLTQDAGSRKKTSTQVEWKRHQAGGDETESWLQLSPGIDGRSSQTVIWDGAASIRALWRQSGSGWLVTVSIVNEHTFLGRGKPPSESSLFQVEITVRTTAEGRIAPYPRVRLLTDDPEEHLLDLIYRHAANYAVGHGCAADWSSPVGGAVQEVRSVVLPAVEVPPVVSAELGDMGPTFDIFRLAGLDADPFDDILQDLSAFASRYRHWIQTLPTLNEDIPDYLESAESVILERLHRACDRIETGIALLDSDTEVRTAFQLANEAMLMQMLRGKGAIVPSSETLVPGLAAWRPFQLAFILMTLPSLSDPSSPDRDLVDLIWFPTGGGKTEAYLAAAAFTIFLRRLRSPEGGGGTAVIMRYTLRLLTSQQFHRASRLIAACELIRRRDPVRLGTIEISIGLWVGLGATPNTYAQAAEKWHDVRGASTPESFFQIDRCVWCSHPILPDRYSQHDEDYGVRATASSFRVFCPDGSCPFHSSLPIAVIDEQLYDEPPSFLLGTVDKFADMPWEKRAGSFFGDYGRFEPPTLIIQDELHLISGPLGTVVGVYEMALDLLASWNGTRPKILASTATIRRADEQCRGLYARPVTVFPPSGLDARDSFFARVDQGAAGRLYLGVMSPGHTASTAMVRVSAALLQAPAALGFSDAELDAWWTLVAYHNSLRELGKSLTFAADDIPARISVIAQAEETARQLDESSVVELTSNIDAAGLTGILQRLETPADHEDEISMLLCTNMLSVGVDVQRLGLMLVNGQPKTTSEYIQATSRVGRGTVPGLVVTLFAPSRPRDRSHYERFVSWHSALYRYVEPTSVTPLAPPALDRALHAVLVGVLRNGGAFPEQTDAARFRADDRSVDRLRQMLKDRVEAMDPSELVRFTEMLDDLLELWQSRAERNSKLEYASRHKAKEVLLLDVNDLTGRNGWSTQRSMRNVDATCRVRVVGGAS